MRRVEKRLRRQDSKNTRNARWLMPVMLMLLAATEGFAGGKRVDPSPATPVNEEAHRLIIVSIPDRKLALLEDGRILRVYPIAVGAAVSPSPVGEFKLLNRVISPAYYHEGKVVRPGKSNPLGSRWMGLDKKGYGIHGTNAPSSIGKAASHGCIRMGKHDVEEFFELVRVGDSVQIFAERNAELKEVFGQPEPAVNAITVASNAPRPLPAGLVVAAMADQF